MAKNSEIRARITADASEFSRGIDTATARTKRFKSEISSMGSGMSGMVSAIAGMGAGVLSFAAAMNSVKEAGKMESFKLSLDAVGDKTQSIEAKLGQLREMAKMPGLDFESAAIGMTRLQAVGFKAGEAQRTITEMANALALVGGSGEDMKGIVIALGQIMSKGKVSAEEIGQIAERLPTIRVAMTQAFGTGESEKIQQMGISAKDFITGLTGALSTMERAGVGINKTMDQVADGAKRISAAVGTSLFNAVVGGLNYFGAGIKDISDGLETVAQVWETTANAIKFNPLVAGSAILQDWDAVKDSADRAAKADEERANERYRAQTREIKLQGDIKKMVIGGASPDETESERVARIEAATKKLNAEAKRRDELQKKENEAYRERVAIIQEIADIEARTEKERAALARKRFDEWGGEKRIATLRETVSQPKGNQQQQKDSAERLRDGIKLQDDLRAAEKREADERAQANRDQIDAISQMVDLHDQLFAKAKDITEELKRQKEARREYAMSDRIETLRGQGRNVAAKRLERQQDVERRAREMEGMGLSPAEAAKEARRAQRDKDGRITTRERQQPTSAIAEFNKRNERDFNPLEETAARNASKRARKTSVAIDDKADKKREGELSALLKAVQDIAKAIDGATKREGAKAINK